MLEGRARPPWSEAGEPLPGEPVLVSANDYRRGLFNGDQGVVLTVSAEGEGEGRPCALFRRGAELLAFPLAALRGRLIPAWATTVHKAQGIEVDDAALMLPARPVRSLTRELVYTALTRARRSVVVVGMPGILQEAIERNDLRHSGLAERILAQVGALSPPAK
jgi:exodeoxyribonuclease V alpha subunit